MPKIEEAVELGRQLGVLESQKKLLEERIREVRAKIAEATGRSTRTKSGDGALGEKIIVFLGSDPEREFTWQEVRDGVGATDSGARSTLSSLWKGSKIHKPGRGRFSLKKPQN